jgi:two-component system LytT family sensor kinase
MRRIEFAEILQRKSVYHTLFWLLLLFILMYNNDFQDSFLLNLSRNLIRIGFFAIIVYLNLYYLIPRFLPANFILYIVLLVLGCLVLAPIEAMLLYVASFSDPVMQNEIATNVQLMFLALFFVGGSSTVIKVIFDWIRHQREAKVLQTMTMQSELKFLRTQINPHFLFNTLNNLYALTLKKSDKAPEIVIKLSEMMRYMLYECNERRVPLKKELKYIRNYLDLEKFRQGEKFDIQLKIKGEVGDQKIAPFMFIPFIENSFKHGISHQLSEGFVNIDIGVDQNSVKFEIENSKAEHKPNQEMKKIGGIGLTNVKRRLNLIYPDAYKLKITDKPSSFKIELFIRLIK